MSGAGAARVREITTTYTLREAGGRLKAYHVRKDTPDGKGFLWRQPDGTWGLNGTPLTDLPLYGAETVSNLGQDELIVLTEGEEGPRRPGGRRPPGRRHCHRSIRYARP